MKDSLALFLGYIIYNKKIDISRIGKIYYYITIYIKKTYYIMGLLKNIGDKRNLCYNYKKGI